MLLPKRGEEVPLDKVKEYCHYFEMNDIIRILEEDPPQKSFSSDGCSMWFDTWGELDFYEACFKHDIRYWCGKPDDEVARLIADAELMIDIARIGAPKMAQIMFNGVRLGGHESLGRDFSWGFGRI